VVNAARKYLNTLAAKAANHHRQAQSQTELNFDSAEEEATEYVDTLREQLNATDIDELSPREALALLYELKQLSQ
jgi:hypothetical protein